MTDFKSQIVAAAIIWLALLCGAAGAQAPFGPDVGDWHLPSGPPVTCRVYRIRIQQPIYQWQWTEYGWQEVFTGCVGWQWEDWRYCQYPHGATSWHRLGAAR